MRLAALLFLLVLSSSASAEELQRFKRVGVVALIGSELGAKYVGMTAFGNRAWKFDTGRLTISDFVRDETARALRERGIDAQALKIDARAWAARNRDPSAFSFKGLIAAYGADVTTSRFKKELGDLSRAHRLDAIIMFVPGRDTVGRSSEAWLGVGETGFGFITRKKNRIDQPYILGSLYLNDSATLKTVHRVRVEAFGATVPIPFRDRAAGFSEPELRQLEASMMDAFRKEVRDSLKHL